jgi:hypothetical protein
MKSRFLIEWLECQSACADQVEGECLLLGKQCGYEQCPGKDGVIQYVLDTMPRVSS